MTAKEQLIELVRAEKLNPILVLETIDEMEPPDIAAAFVELDTPGDIRLFRILPKSIASDVFAELSHEQQQSIISAMTDKEQSFIINDLFADDAADLIEEMPPRIVTRLLKNATEETRSEINTLLRYPEDSAGSIMTTEYVRLKEDQTVDQVFDTIRKQGVHKETIYTCYVTDADRVLVGFVSLKDLIYATPKATIGNIMHESVISLNTTNTHEETSAAFMKYGFVALPVVDSENKLVGIVTVDDAMRSTVENTTETMQTMAGVKHSDKPYLKMGVIEHSRNRILWLMFLMISAMLTGFVISGSEDALLAVPALMAFIPMLMDTGGNAGSQSSTLIIRGMAVGELSLGNWLRVLWKETRVALCCGLVLGTINFGRIVLLNGHDSMMLKVALTVTLSLCVTILIAKTIGCMLPMLAKLARLDPALMAAPLITTIVDTFSLLVYFGIAKALLGI